MYRDDVRCLVIALSLIACGKASTPQASQEAARPAEVAPPPAPVVVAPDAPAYPPDTYAELGEALAAIIPADARVIGLGELHSRVDRAQVRSALSRFTAALPGLGAKVSDLVVETWIVDPTCGKTATQATAQLEANVKRPEATKSEVAQLADAARAAGAQPHAMRLTCDDYKRLLAGGDADPIVMLGLTTRELGRIAASAVVHRDKQPDDGTRRPWILVYGGALHNDRFPDPAIAEWSYAALADKVTGDRFVEIDLIVPELAAADAMSRTQPWFHLVETAGDRISVWRRNERSFVVILPRTR